MTDKNLFKEIDEVCSLLNDKDYLIKCGLIDYGSNDEIHLWSKLTVDDLVNCEVQFANYVDMLIDLFAPNKTILELLVHHDFDWISNNLVDDVDSGTCTRSILGKVPSKLALPKCTDKPETIELALFRRYAIGILLRNPMVPIASAFEIARSYIEKMPNDVKGVLDALANMDLTPAANAFKVNLTKLDNSDLLITYLSMLLNINTDTLVREYFDLGYTFNTGEIEASVISNQKVRLGLPKLQMLKNHQITDIKYPAQMIDDVMRAVRIAILNDGNLRHIESVFTILCKKYDIKESEETTPMIKPIEEPIDTPDVVKEIIENFIDSPVEESPEEDKSINNDSPAEKPNEELCNCEESCDMEEPKQDSMVRKFSKFANHLANAFDACPECTYIKCKFDNEDGDEDAYIKLVIKKY